MLGTIQTDELTHRESWIFENLQSLDGKPYLFPLKPLAFGSSTFFNSAMQRAVQLKQPRHTHESTGVDRCGRSCGDESDTSSPRFTDKALGLESERMKRLAGHSVVY